MTGRLVLVVVSPRVPPGLLSWPAWEALRSGVVLTGAASPQLPFLADAGIDVQVLEPSAEVLHDRAAAGETVVWLTTADADAELVRAVTASLTDRRDHDQLVPADLQVGEVHVGSFCSLRSSALASRPSA